MSFGVRLLILPFLMVAPTSVLAQGPGPVNVYHARNENGTYSVFVSTHLPAPIQVYVTFPTLENAIPDGPIPLDYIVVPNAKDARMVTFTPAPGKMVFRYETKWWYGDPESASHDDAVLYLLPFGDNIVATVAQGYNGTFTHQDEYAIDFRMREGTEVRASRDGVVIGTKDDSRSGGPDPSFNEQANFVMVYHADGTFAQYAHLKYRGVVVRTGQQVRAGELIGYSGNTGYSRGPHLHFAVHLPTSHGSKTIPTRFRDRTGRILTPQ